MAFVKLVGFDGSSIGSWAKVELHGLNDVADFADRACTRFASWGVNATQASLYRVEWTGEGDPDAAAVSAALSGNPLEQSRLLLDVRISPRSFVLVRKTVGAAASGACACLLSDHPRSLTSPRSPSFLLRAALRLVRADEARVFLHTPPSLRLVARDVLAAAQHWVTSLIIFRLGSGFMSDPAAVENSRLHGTSIAAGRLSGHAVPDTPHGSPPTTRRVLSYRDSNVARGDVFLKSD